MTRSLRVTRPKKKSVTVPRPDWLMQIYRPGIGLDASCALRQTDNRRLGKLPEARHGQGGSIVGQHTVLHHKSVAACQESTAARHFGQPQFLTVRRGHFGEEGAGSASQRWRTASNRSYSL